MRSEGEHRSQYDLETLVWFSFSVEELNALVIS